MGILCLIPRSFIILIWTTENNCSPTIENGTGDTITGRKKIDLLEIWKRRNLNREKLKKSRKKNAIESLGTNVFFVDQVKEDCIFMKSMARTIKVDIPPTT